MLRELLVLCCFPLLIIALLLPAVQASREAARRMQCCNNLKTHALGIMCFESTYRRLPIGTAPTISAEASLLNQATSVGSFGWGTDILPYIERQDLHDRIRLATPTMAESLDDPENLRAMQSPLVEYVCPTSISPALNAARPFSGLMKTSNQPLSLSNYVGANGSGELRRSYAEGANGMFSADKSLRLAAISDGLSSTIMLGERAWQRRSRWINIDHRAAVVFGTRGVRQNSQQGLADTLACGKYRLNFTAVDAATGKGNEFARRGFSSNHPRIINVALGDGSVRVIVDDIDADMDSTSQSLVTDSVVDSVWERLLCRNDGQPVDEY